MSQTPRSSKAIAVWQWWNYYLSQIPTGKRILTVNMDETSVCIFQGIGVGNIFTSKEAHITQNYNTTMQRTCVTHVAFICDDAELQRFMPQVIIANEHTIRDDDLAALRAASPVNVRILRRRSAWVDAEICALFLFWLVIGLGRLRDKVQIVLLFDAYKAHFADVVLKACAYHGIWPLVIPASLTWLLQPLDTHAFLPYKLCLQREYQLARIQTHDGVVGTRELFACLFTAITNVLGSTNWAFAFLRNGFGEQQSGLSRRVESWLQLAGRVEVGDARISDAQVRSCLPRRTVTAVRNIWMPIDASVPCPDSASAPTASSSHMAATTVVDAYAVSASAASSSSRLPVGSPLVSIARPVPRGTRLLHGRSGLRWGSHDEL